MKQWVKVCSKSLIVLIPLFRRHTGIEFSIFLLFYAFFCVNMCLFTIKENNVDSSTLLSLHHLDLFYDKQLVCSRGLLINRHAVVTCSLPCLNGIFYRLNWKFELFLLKVFILGDSDKDCRDFVDRDCSDIYGWEEEF